MLGVVAPAALANWDRPFRFSSPFSLDVLAPQLSVSAAGVAAVGFGVQDSDHPSVSTAFASWRTAAGRLSGPRRVPAAKQVLDLAFEGPGLDLLTGTSPRGQACCSAAEVLRMSPDGRFGHQRTLVTGLTGPAAGRLVPLPSRLLAAVATDRGVWVAQTAPSGRFGAVHVLTAADARPNAVQAAALANGGAIVAWTQTDRRSSTPRRIYVAAGTVRQAPGPGRPVLSVASGHRIDELALAGGPGPPTLAWIESWYDRHGVYQSRVGAADLTRSVRPRWFATRGLIASGLSLAGDGGGDRLLAWKTCDVAGACSVRELVRRSGRRFGTAARLATIDAAAAPAASLASSGDGLVGWIDRGHVFAAALRARATRFGSPHTVSSTNYAANLALGFGPRREAIAVWSQGTLAPDVIGAVYRLG